MLALANFVMKRNKFNCVLPSGHLSLSLVSFFYHQLLHFLTSSKDCVGLEIVFFPKFFFSRIPCLCSLLSCHQQQDMSEAGVSTISEPSTPERVFKVVFIGDSGVGKSSFIHRFCHDAWKPSFTATIGNTFFLYNSE